MEQSEDGEGIIKEEPQYEILDLAADTSSEFDLANNSREFLLSYFKIPEGSSAVEKAEANKMLFEDHLEFEFKCGLETKVQM